MQVEDALVDDYGFPIPQNARAMYAKWHESYQLTMNRRQERWDKVFPESLFLDRGSFERTRTLQRFIQKGIPQLRRPTVWLCVSGAAALSDANPNLYERLTANDAPSLLTTTEQQIRNDLARTFPENNVFQAKFVDSGALYRILSAAARYMEDVQYCQGMNLIAGMLMLAFAHANQLKQLREKNPRDKVPKTDPNSLTVDFQTEKGAFFLLIVFVRNILVDYFSPKMAGLLCDLAVLGSLIEERDKQLARFLRRQSLPVGAVASRWLVTAFANCLPGETTFRLWDCIFYDGIKCLFGAALNLVVNQRNTILSANDPGAAIVSFNALIELSPCTLNCHEFAASFFPGFPRRKAHVSQKEVARLRIANGNNTGNSSLNV